VLRALLTAVVCALAAPASAAAHAVIQIAGGELVYWSEDVGSLSRLEVTASLTSIQVYDPGTVGGMQAPPSCRPGRVDPQGHPVEFTCPATGVSRVRIDVGVDEDVVSSAGPIAQRVDGGSGADRLTTGDTDDELRGDEGNDTLIAGGGADLLRPGIGADAVSAGTGDDAIESADGEPDTISCGEGADRVTADTVDRIGEDCESARRSFVAPPSAAAEGDTTPPRLTSHAASRQRLGSGRVVLTASSSEAGTIDASAFLVVGGVNLRVTTFGRGVAAERRVRLTLRLTRDHVRRVRRALGRGHSAHVDVRIAATDRAGNSTRAMRWRIRLRR
jgi:hypothetical protein